MLLMNSAGRLGSKLLLAAVFAAISVGAVALRLAWASPGSGTTSTGISGPVVLDEFETTSETDDHELEMKIKGLSDVYVTNIKVVPGGFSGWHWHPGPSIISVKSGTATFYQADAPLTPNVYPAGTGFVEDAGRVHELRNESADTPLEIIVVQIVPLGAPRRIEADVP